MNYTLKFRARHPVILSVTAYRFALSTFALTMGVLVVLLLLWAQYYLGPEVSIYDVGAPHLRAMV